jgi:hypothetical protein
VSFEYAEERAPAAEASDAIVLALGDVLNKIPKPREHMLALFAAQAPAEMPRWFLKEQPKAAVESPLALALQRLTERDRRLVLDVAAGELDEAVLLDAPTLIDALAAQRKWQAEHERRRHDEERRLFIAWRWRYAELMLAELDRRAKPLPDHKQGGSP